MATAPFGDLRKDTINLRYACLRAMAFWSVLAISCCWIVGFVAGASEAPGLLALVPIVLVGGIVGYVIQRTRLSGRARAARKRWADFLEHGRAAATNPDLFSLEGAAFYESIPAVPAFRFGVAGQVTDQRTDLLNDPASAGTALMELGRDIYFMLAELKLANAAFAITRVEDHWTGMFLCPYKSHTLVWFLFQLNVDGNIRHVYYRAAHMSNFDRTRLSDGRWIPSDATVVTRHGWAMVLYSMFWSCIPILGLLFALRFFVYWFGDGGRVDRNEFDPLFGPPASWALAEDWRQDQTRTKPMLTLAHSDAVAVESIKKTIVGRMEALIAPY